MAVFFEALVFNISLCLDALAAGLALGAEKIRVPILSIFIIDLVCAAFLTASLALGAGLGSFISAEEAAAVSAMLLIFIGIYKIGGGFDTRAEEADKDRSRHISSGEAAALAAALSLDGAAAGLGAGLNTSAAAWIIGLSLVVNAAAIAVGIFCGRRFAAKMRHSGGFLAGVMLIALAVGKIYA